MLLKSINYNKVIILLIAILYMINSVHSTAPLMTADELKPGPVDIRPIAASLTKLSFKKGPKFGPPQTQYSTTQVANNALASYGDLNKIPVNSELLLSAETLDKTSADKLQDLKKNLIDFETFHSSFVESLVSLEAELQDIPPFNPDMIPIPEKVRELVNVQLQDPTYNYPSTPVYIVKEPGKQFVENGRFFEARVGMDGPNLADYILTRSGPQVKTMNLKSRPMKLAVELNEKAGTNLTEHRGVIHQPMPDMPMIGEIVANLKPPPVEVKNTTLLNLLPGLKQGQDVLAGAPKFIEENIRINRKLLSNDNIEQPHLSLFKPVEKNINFKNNKFAVKRNGIKAMFKPAVQPHN